MTEGKTVQNSERGDGFCNEDVAAPAVAETAADASASGCFGSSRIE